MIMESTVNMIAHFATRKGKKVDDILTREECWSLHKGNALTPAVAEKVEKELPDLTVNFLMSYDAEYFEKCKEFEYIKNKQKNHSVQNPRIFAIARYWLGHFENIEIFSNMGEEDLPELKKIYEEKYKWKPGQIGITEQSFKLIEISGKVIEEDDF